MSASLTLKDIQTIQSLRIPYVPYVPKDVYDKAIAALKEARDELYVISCATRFDDRIQALNADAAKQAVTKVNDTLKELGEIHE